MRYATIGMVFFLMFAPGITHAGEMSEGEKAQASIDIIEPVLDLCRSRLSLHLSTMQSIKDNPGVQVGAGTRASLAKAIDRLRKCINELESDLATLKTYLPGGNISSDLAMADPGQPHGAPNGPRKRVSGMRAFMISRIGVNDNDVWDAYNKMADAYNKIWGF